MRTFSIESVLGLLSQSFCTRDTQAKATSGISSGAVFVSSRAGSLGSLRAVSYHWYIEHENHSIYSILHILYGYSI